MREENNNYVWKRRTIIMSETENNNHVWERRTIMSERGEQQSYLREGKNNHKWLLFSSLRHACCFPLSDMIVVLLSQTWLLFSSLRNDCCSPLHVWESRTTIMSERGEQQSFLRENNNYVWERRTIIIYERGEQQLCRHDCCSPLSDMIAVLFSQKWLLFSSLRHDCCSPPSDMIIVLLSQTWLLLTIMSERGEQ
jgi:hypothetical protein